MIEWKKQEKKGEICVTIKDLAAQTGYSVGTISRVLNNQPNVSEKARRTILDAASASGFRLNPNAKQLKQQRGTSVLLICKGTSNDLFRSLIEAIQSRMHNYPLSVDYVDEDANEVLRAVELCQEKKPLGILFLGGNTESFRQDFHNIDVPCVLITGSAAGLSFDNLSSVSTDDYLAGYQAISHLVGLGHRQIAVVGGNLEISTISRLRYEGCVEAMRRYRIPFDGEKDYFAGRFSFGDGYQGVMALLDAGRKFTAIFAMADVMAIGAIRALRDRGLRVPEDVSVIGLDGLDIGDYMMPRLTTVRQSVKDLAGRTVEILEQQLRADVPGPRHETIPSTVDGKESTRLLK